MSKSLSKLLRPKGLLVKAALVIVGLLAANLWVLLFELFVDGLGIIDNPWIWVVAIPLWIAAPILLLSLLTRSPVGSILKDLWARRGALELGDRAPLLTAARELALTGQSALLIERVLPLVEELYPEEAPALKAALDGLEAEGWDPVFDALEQLN